MQIIASVSPAELWLSDHGIRVFYLHVLLLGAFTTGMAAYMMQDLTISKKYFYIILTAVLLVISSLVLMTHFWPAFLSGVWIYYALASVALLPVLATLMFWVKMRLLLQKHR